MTHAEIISHLIAEMNDRASSQDNGSVVYTLEFKDLTGWIEVSITRTEKLLRYETHLEPAEYDVRFSASLTDIYCEDLELKAKISDAVNGWE